MNYEVLADTTAITHIIIIVALFVGLLISFRYKRFRPWEAGALIVVVFLWSYYGNCPLTILEQYFRDLAGQDANLTSVGFLPYYLDKLFSFNLSSKLVQRTTFFTGGMFFAGSLEWFAPYIHFPVFHVRKNLRKFFRLKRVWF